MRIAGAVVAVAAGLAGIVVEAATPGGVGGVVDEPAVRDVQVAASTDERCDLETVEALAARHPGVRQFVVMVTDDFADTRGTVEVAVRAGDGSWRCQVGQRAARFGRTGTRPLLERVSGDGSTPAGVFPLGEVTAWDGERFSMFGNRPDPGALVPYRDVKPDDCWGATANEPRYQHLVADRGCEGPDDEWLPRFGDVYSHAAVIGANLDPISGDDPGETPYAAAIFLHRHSYDSGGAPRATSGCVSLPYDDLVRVIRLLDPRLTPHFAIGPRDWLHTTA